MLLMPSNTPRVMIIDNEIVITGFFNFTKAAEERNAENLLIIHGRQLADQYVRTGNCTSVIPNC